MFLKVLCNNTKDHPSSVLSDMLDVFICAFSRGQKEERYFELFDKYGKKTIEHFSELLACVVMELEAGNDILGEVYMEMASRTKSKALGQFFTPMPVCDFMAQALNCDELGFGKSICDPACGSGRTLLAATRKWSDFKKLSNTVYACDLDHICLKMCVVNCFLNGLMGTYIHGNSLSLESYNVYVIYPDENTCCPSLRFLEPAEAEKVFFDYREKLDNSEPEQKITTSGEQLLFQF